MERRFRLTKSTDFQRVRRLGQAYAHPLLVLVVSRGETDNPRIGVVVGRFIGNAVKRNRVKRRLRSAISPFCREIDTGWDMIFIARKPIRDASFNMIQNVVRTLLKRAKLLGPNVT